MRKIVVIVCLFLLVGLSSCAGLNRDSSDDSRSIPETASVEETEAEKEAVTEAETTTETTAETTTEATTKVEKENTESRTIPETKGLSIDDIPPYFDKAYIEINGNQPSFTDEDKKRTDAFEEYSPLDSKGRCGVAYANICKELMPTEERGEIGDIRPSGWHTVKYPDVIKDRYLYNRSHLIAFSLAGENANEKNLITGTRYLNQETMSIFELRVLDYVRANEESHVLYRVTPFFEGDNLLATGVQMEAWSVEDEGKGICFNVFCYNVQPHVVINYANGDSHLAEDVTTTEETTTETTESQITEAIVSEETTQSTGNESEYEKQTRTYILNTNTKKIHLPDCRSVKDMAEHNKLECESTLSDLKQQGYSPCGRCLAGYK